LVIKITIAPGAFMLSSKNIQYYFFICLIIFNGSLNAVPFESCPSKAFLIQQTTAQLYGVNLVRGNYDLLADNLGTSDKINAVGFSFHNNYIYAWGY
jgi:hypothetical protein